jgi:hypothetical protein
VDDTQNVDVISGDEIKNTVRAFNHETNFKWERPAIDRAGQGIGQSAMTVE